VEVAVEEKRCKDMKLVRESLGDILKPKTPSEVTDEIKRRLEGKPLETILEKNNFIIYQIKKSDDIKDIVKNFGGRDEDVFFNFYLILDNTSAGFRQIIGVKVSPDGTMNAMDARGNKIEQEYLEKFS
jgi:hypothetical protein